MALKKFLALTVAATTVAAILPAVAFAQGATAPAAQAAPAGAPQGRGPGRGGAGGPGRGGGGAPVASVQDVPVPAALVGPKITTGYRVPRVLGGLPDLGGSWTNSTLTGQNRGAQFGTRLIMTEEEVAAIEGRNNDLIARGNEASDPNATIKDIEAKNNCSGGRSAAAQACNYDAAWTAPGDSVMRVNGQPRTSLLTTANGQPPARLPNRQADPRAVGVSTAGEGTAEATGPGARQNDNPEGRGLAERCIVSFGRSAPPPMFDQLYNSTYQFQLGTNSVAIWVEMVHDVRIINTTPGAKHRTDGVRPYFGDSIGHWEGDTLVVETTNLPAAQQFGGSWINLTVTERFTRVSRDRMNYQFTLHDPTMWATDWGGEYEFARSAPPFEYACHEGNYGLEGILAGARAAEAQASGVALTTEGVAR